MSERTDGQRVTMWDNRWTEEHHVGQQRSTMWGHEWDNSWPEGHPVGS